MERIGRHMLNAAVDCLRRDHRKAFEDRNHVGPRCFVGHAFCVGQARALAEGLQLLTRCPRAFGASCVAFEAAATVDAVVGDGSGGDGARVILRPGKRGRAAEQNELESAHNGGERHRSVTGGGRERVGRKAKSGHAEQKFVLDQNTHAESISGLYFDWGTLLTAFPATPP